MQETQEEIKNVPVEMDRFTTIGYTLIVITLGIFFLWATMSRLDSGAIASGEVIPSSKVYTVQHKDGGVIHKIYVNDGHRVKKDQLLVELDNISTKSELEINKIDQNSLESLIERLEAEKEGRKSYKTKIINSKNTQVQYQLFLSRKEGLEKDFEILEKRIKQIEDEIVGHEAEINSLQLILLSAKETFNMNNELYQNRYIDKRKLLESENFVADVEGKIGKKYADISKAKQKITETKIHEMKIKNQWSNDVLEQLKQAKDALAITNEKIKIISDRLKRSYILSPADGVVHGIKFNTIGGVIKQGEEILQIVPENQNLIVEAKLMPDHIDTVRLGLIAYVRISAYQHRSYNAVKGKVSEISPNTFKDPSMGTTYYKVKVEIDQKDLNEIEKMQLQPGMLAQVEIVTGERTPLEYMIQPIKDSFHRSFKED